jgi:hypothetical protein
MRVPRDAPFPFEAARDLLGILRAMYAAAKAEGKGERKLAAIRDVGRDLRAAMDLALECEPNTLGHAAAWARAEEATLRLSELVDCTTPIEPALNAAAERLSTGRLSIDAREQLRRGRLGRG